MTALDIVVLALVALTGFAGARRGFVKEAMTLVAWAAAIGAVKVGLEPATATLTGVVGTRSGAMALAFVLLFGFVLTGGKLLASALGRHSKASMLGPFDRVLGAGFGALKGLIIATLGFLAVNWGAGWVSRPGSEGPAWLVEARSTPLLRASSRALVRVTGELRGDGDDAVRP